MDSPSIEASNAVAGDRSCAVCSSPATQICGGCGDVYYCSREHQRKHWAVHKTQCKPYKIVQDEKFGRYIKILKCFS